MRLTKEEFCKAINKYKSMIEAESKVLSAFGVDYFEPSAWIDEYYEFIITMSDIDRANDDNVDFGNDIDFFCWELNFGEKWYPGVIQENGENIYLRTPEELYDYLTREIE